VKVFLEQLVDVTDAAHSATPKALAWK